MSAKAARAIPKNPLAWCGCCQGGGKVARCEFWFRFGDSSIETVLAGVRDCPGCDGTGVSWLAHQWRKEMGFE